MKISKKLATGLPLSLISVVVLLGSVIFFDSTNGNIWLSKFNWVVKNILIFTPLILGTYLGIKGIKLLTLVLVDTISERSD